jgi:predicted Zn finger-like uncharacterized protein
MRVSCPYCNHAFAINEPPAGGRVMCPRCGETFPFRGPVDDDGDEPAFRDGPAVAPPVQATARRGWSARRTVAVAGVLGLIGLAVGLIVATRKDVGRGEPEELPAAAAVPPPALAGLRYLRDRSNVVAGVRVGPVLEYAARTNQDPRELLAAAGVPQPALAVLDQTGLTLPQIDHFALGANVPGEDEMPFATLAVVLRRPPDDEGRFLRALKATPDRGGKKDWYTVSLPGVPLDPELVRVSGREWVLGVGGGAMLRANPHDAKGSGHLSAGLRELLAEKLPPDAAVWAVADGQRWAEKPVVGFVVKQLLKRERLLPVLAKGEAAAVGLSFGDPPRARLYVRTTDEPSRELLQEYFRKADATAVVGGAGRVALYDAAFDPRAGVGPVRRFAEEVGK